MVPRLEGVEMNESTGTNAAFFSGRVDQTQKSGGNRAYVHTIPEKFDNGVLFLRLGLTPTLVLHESGAFRKRSSNWRNLQSSA